MSLTLDMCNMDLKWCCANRILFLCIKHQLLGHISSSGISSWKILDESQESESSEKQHTLSDIQGENFKHNLKHQIRALRAGIGLSCFEILQIDRWDQANVLRQHQKWQDTNEYKKKMSILF